MNAFLRASTWARNGEHFTTTIDAAWAQGKGAFGGLLSAGMLRAMTDVTVPAGSARVARVLHMTYCAPARPGPLALEVVVERAGATMTTTTARALQDGKAVALATATFAAPSSRPAPRAIFNDAPMPVVPAPASVEAVAPDVPLMPTFTQFFEYRFCIGPPPFTGADDARLGGWVKLREPGPDDARADAPLVAALIDTYPPAVMPRLDDWRPMASVNLTIDFLAPPSVARAAGNFLLDSSARVGDGGTTDEAQALWSEDGVLLASCRQLVAIL